MSSVAQPLAVRSRSSALLKDYAEPFKARKTALIVITAGYGSYLAAARSGVSRWSDPLLARCLTQDPWPVEPPGSTHKAA